MKKTTIQLVCISYTSMILLLLAPGCATRYHQTALRERHSLEKTTLKQTGYDVPLYREKNITAQEIVRGITRDDTVRMALMTEPSLYAQLETLGISKADLAQAGFLQNPRIDTIFQFPRNAGAKGCIELDVTMTISDLWQIPMRKKVAEDKLAITSTALLQKILSVIEHAKQAYNRVLFETAQLQTTAIILETVEQLRNRIYQLQCAGYSSDFEVNYAQVAVGEWQTQVINQKKLLQNAYIDLRNTIGTETTTQPVFALETLTTQEFLLTNPFDLIDYAKQNKPETHINRLQIQQAQHQRSLEKSKIFNNVEFGIRFNRDPDGSKLTGPSIGFEMPFFDWNQAQIAKSRYEEKMARHDLESSFADIEVSVLQLYTTINSYIDTITVYESTIIPYSIKALEYAKTYANSMQLDFITQLNAEIELYKKQLLLNNHRFELLQAIAALETELGGSIPSIALQQQ